MYRSISLVTTVSVVCLALSSAMARADLPPDQTVYYNIREVPTDPDSDVVFIVVLDLTAADSDGDWIGWEIATAEFWQPTGAKLYSIWTDNTVDVDSPDGLWWVEHANPDKPDRSEFVLPPWLTGTATAEDPSNDDLDYDFEGVEYTPPPGGPPFEVTGALTYEFTLHQASEPLEEGDAEAVEIADELHES